MAKVELKQPIVQEVSGLLENAKTCVLVDYRGITVDVDTKLRKELREAGVTYKVYKNTLIKLAVKGTQFEELSKDLEGPTAIAVSSEDVTAPARIIAGYCKNVDALSMKSGVVDGVYYDEKGINVIATIPSQRFCCPSSLAASSLRSPTLLVLLSRSPRRMAKRAKLPRHNSDYPAKLIKSK